MIVKYSALLFVVAQAAFASISNLCIEGCCGLGLKFPPQGLTLSAESGISVKIPGSEILCCPCTETTKEKHPKHRKPRFPIIELGYCPNGDPDWPCCDQGGDTCDFIRLIARLNSTIPPHTKMCKSTYCEEDCLCLDDFFGHIDKEPGHHKHGHPIIPALGFCPNGDDDPCCNQGGDSCDFITFVARLNSTVPPHTKICKLGDCEEGCLCLGDSFGYLQPSSSVQTSPGYDSGEKSEL